jgi:N-acetylneuraminate synthase
MVTDERNTLFIILARGGSKRLPGKNLLEVGGVPLVGRAVRTARAAARRLGGEARVVVSTDDEAIARTARDFGADTPFLRPPDLASDTASSIAALRHALGFFQARGETFHEVVLLQPTSPLTSAADVVAALEELRRHPGAPVVTVSGASPGHAAFTYGLHDGTLAAASTGELVALNGAVYAFRPEWLAGHDALVVPGATRVFAMPPERSIDVDTPADLDEARAAWTRTLPWHADRCLVIAEAGVNHNGNMDAARRLIDAAAEARADAVKFQAFSADRIVTRSAPKAAYQRTDTQTDESQQDMLRSLELTPEQLEQLAHHARQRGIMFLASAFGEEDVDLLDSLDVASIKLGSGEITNHPLLAHAAHTGRPVILSTGASWMREVASAVECLRAAHCSGLALLHCVSSYPAEAGDANLRAMDTLSSAFGVPVGFSDHTLGHEVALAAVARGARIIEKHFTLDRTLPGPDHLASLEPAELAEFVRAIRRTEAALGDGIKRPLPSEEAVSQVARRSLVGATDLPAGTKVEFAHLVCKRPATGICPTRLADVLGLRLTRPLAADEVLTWAHFSPPDKP